jgi:glutathione-independent formaldehyde dehydrogenase
MSVMGAAVVIVGDMIPERLAQARSFGCETIDLRERILTLCTRKPS